MMSQLSSLVSYQVINNVHLSVQLTNFQSSAFGCLLSSNKITCSCIEWHLNLMTTDTSDSSRDGMSYVDLIFYVHARALSDSLVCFLQ